MKLRELDFLDLRPMVYDVCNAVHLNGQILPDDYKQNFARIKIEQRSQIDNSEKWAVTLYSNCLSKSDFEFHYEPSPSERTDDFIENTRFDTVRDALDAINKYRQKELARVFEKGYKVFQPK